MQFGWLPLSNFLKNELTFANLIRLSNGQLEEVR